MDYLHKLQSQTKAAYDSGGNPLDLIFETVAYSLKKLQDNASIGFRTEVDGKKYIIQQAGKTYARPCCQNLLIPDTKNFKKAWDDLLASANPHKNIFTDDPASANSVLYTAIYAFSASYDLWKSTSRKTPGTFFEVVIGSLASMVLPTYVRSHYIPIPDQEEKVTTDIVFKSPDREGGIVIPVKITTRERIVQPYAHQRILDSVFGVNHYKSILVCMSETQRDETVGVNEICVPGTIKLFQKHLAALHGIYYLDPPRRYCTKDITALVPVRSVGELLTNDLGKLAS